MTTMPFERAPSVWNASVSKSHVQTDEVFSCTFLECLPEFHLMVGNQTVCEFVGADGFKVFFRQHYAT